MARGDWNRRDHAWRPGPFHVKMMPGQEPCTDDELRKVYLLVADAADGDPGEFDEPKVVQSCE